MRIQIRLNLFIRDIINVPKVKKPGQTKYYWHIISNFAFHKSPNNDIRLQYPAKEDEPS
jgi:hypothetical protein